MGTSSLLTVTNGACMGGGAFGCSFLQEQKIVKNKKMGKSGLGSFKAFISINVKIDYINVVN
ncbi:hypothetical protein FLGSB24_07970 [Flavobacterium sp. GSB-24]|nr:hypothetical protein FLGSB24_07970 [Flavobacterium sp. GSB-24]